MKKATKRLLSIIAVILVLVLGIGTYLLYPILIMNPVETGTILDTDIYAIKNSRSNMFLYKTGDGYIMIDAGSDTKNVEKSLIEIGIDAADVKWIFITHTDDDHISSLALFPNADVYMSEGVSRSGSGRNTVPSNVESAEVGFLIDNQELLCDKTVVRCIKAPGHTDGSMVYLIDGKYLFTGDAFKVTGGKVGVHPFTTDKEVAGKTIENLKETINGSSLILTSHYGYHEKLEF